MLATGVLLEMVIHVNHKISMDKKNATPFPLQRHGPSVFLLNMVKKCANFFQTDPVTNMHLLFSLASPSSQVGLEEQIQMLSV